MPRSFVIGDIHGNFKPLIELFGKVRFDYKNDRLISLGDLVDRGPEPVRVVDEMMKVRNLVFIMGNHDLWCSEYLKTGFISPDWVYQGAHTTIKDYEINPQSAKSHLGFFATARLYHIDKQNRLFVHGGFDSDRPFEEQKGDKRTLLWNRSLYQDALKYHEDGRIFKEFREIYIGHSPTQLIFKDEPARLSNVFMMDTGAGHRRFLSIMDLDTGVFNQARCDF
ncbi:MAG: metallophosphoesterase [Bacteroidota bacterium]